MIVNGNWKRNQYIIDATAKSNPHTLNLDLTFHIQDMGTLQAVDQLKAWANMLESGAKLMRKEADKMKAQL